MVSLRSIHSAELVPNSVSSYLDKKIWLLQYGLPEGMGPLSDTGLSKSLQNHCPRIAELASKKDIEARVLTMDNIDGILREITEAC